jgi:hypothetical protein
MRANTTRGTSISSMGSIGFLTNLMSTSSKKTGVFLAKSLIHLGWFMRRGHPHPWPCFTLFTSVPIFLHAHYFWSRGLICQCRQPPLGLPIFPSQSVGRHSSQQGYLAWKLLWRKAWHPEPWYI